MTADPVLTEAHSETSESRASTPQSGPQGVETGSASVCPGPEPKTMYPLLVGGVDMLVPEGAVLRFAWPETRPEDLVSIKVKGVTFEVARDVLAEEEESYLGALVRFHPEETGFTIKDADPKYFPVIFHYLKSKHNEEDPALKYFKMLPEDSRGIDKLCEWLMPRPQPPVRNAIPSLFPWEPAMYHLMEGDDLLVLLNTSYGAEHPDIACVDPVLVKAYLDKDLETLNAHMVETYGALHKVDSLQDLAIHKVARGQPFKIAAYDGSMYVRELYPSCWLCP